MKKTVVVLTALLFSGMAASVQAAHVSFNPGAVKINVEAGKSSATPIQVNADSTGPVFIIKLQVGSTVEGNLPPSWLKPANLILDTIVAGPSTSMNLEVAVPDGTPGGIYSAIVKPQVVQATESVTSEDLTVEVEVPSQSSCNGVPGLENVVVGPTDIWAAREKEVEINVAGTVVVAPDCQVSGTVTMESNGGAVSAPLAIDDLGNFTAGIPITVAKDAKAKEGTVYNGLLTVVDELGSMASMEFFVEVDHDRDHDGDGRGRKHWHRKKGKDRDHKRNDHGFLAKNDHDRRR